MKPLVKFIEIPAADFYRAVKFYETLFNLKMSVSDCGDVEKMAFFGDFSVEPNIAISWSPKFHPSKDGLLVSFSVDSIDTTLSLVNENGGNTVIDKTKIQADGMGYFAVFVDSEGNSIGLYSDN